MKLSEIRESNEEELGQRLGGLHRELFDLRMARAAGKLDKPHRLRQVRRDIARIRTLQREKIRPAAASGSRTTRLGAAAAGRTA